MQQNTIKEVEARLRLHSYFHGPLQISAQNLLSSGKIPMGIGFWILLVAKGGKNTAEFIFA